MQTIVEILKAKPCHICNERLDTICMDFDHIDPATKSHNVSELAAAGRWNDFIMELSKVRIVCANCHSVETHNQMKAGRIRRRDGRVLRTHR